MKSVRIENFPALDYATNEALNTLCTNIVFAGEEVRRVLITSCREHEGKSFISMGIMHTLASMGDVKRRYGMYPEAKWNSNLAIKKYFEDKMGKDVYVAVDKANFRP